MDRVLHIFRTRAMPAKFERSRECFVVSFGITLDDIGSPEDSFGLKEFGGRLVW